MDASLDLGIPDHGEGFLRLVSLFKSEVAFPPQVCFEVSAHSGRVHFHLAKDGSRPLGLSLPLDLLLLKEESASIVDLLSALDRRSGCLIPPHKSSCALLNS